MAGHTSGVPNPRPDLADGTVVSGRYRLEAHLGSGATSSVWRARDLDLGRPVALKALFGAGVAPELAARFEREATILGRLSHPNVVPVYATGNDDGRPYLVMAHVEGLSLDRVLQDGPLPVDDAVGLAADVAAGLAAAHRAGVVHRDVKPANIVCGADGTPRLVDFGIARADDLTSVTAADSVLGTASYLSPEQARGEVPGPASDVYALGCVLYEALTGHPPFAGSSALAVAYRQVHDDPVPPSSARPEVPAAVEAVVLRSLAKDPADRYPSGAELEADLRRVRAGEAPASVTAPTEALAPVPAEATMVMPAVAADPPAEVIDPAPLAPAPPRSARPWGVAAAACAAVAVLAIVLGNLTGGSGADPGSDRRSTTTTTAVAVVATTPPPTAPPVTAPPPPKVKAKPGKGHGKHKG